jgi:fatty acid desaturase
MLRHRADRRALLWAFLLFPAAGFAPYIEPRVIPWLLPLSLYLGLSAGPLSHNHNHCPVFKSRRANAYYAASLGLFWGFPSFGWIPTHNLNHHKFVNRPGDATITWRYSRKNTWLVASTYYFVSAYWQSGVLREYVAKARAHHPGQYRQILAQLVAVFGGHALLLALGVGLRGVKVGSLVWAFGFGIPALFAGWSSIFVNYVQHVHCDPWSRYDHSRNFVSKLENWLLFNNGYHTAHHASAGTHWSQLPEAHAKVAGLIHPDLNQRSLFGFCLRTYGLGAIHPRYRTRQIGRAAYDPPGGGPMPLVAGPVESVEAGVNAAMASGADA